MRDSIGVSRCGFSLVDLPAGQITVKNDFHGELPSLAGVFPMAGYADYYLGRERRRLCSLATWQPTRSGFIYGE
jgi:hypothetical protein